MIVGAVVLSTVMGNPVEMRPLFVSKVNTTVQIVLAAFVLAELAFALNFSPARSLVWLAALLTAISAGAYLVLAASHGRICGNRWQELRRKVLKTLWRRARP